jgi:hypothetical protein
MGKTKHLQFDLYSSDYDSNKTHSIVMPHVGIYPLVAVHDISELCDHQSLAASYSTAVRPDTPENEISFRWKGADGFATARMKNVACIYPGYFTKQDPWFSFSAR